MKKIFLLFIMFLFLSGCVIPGKTTYETVADPIYKKAMAQFALNNFLGLLNQKQYEQAAPYFGSSFDLIKRIEGNNDISDNAELLKNYCTINKGICLIPKIISGKELAENEYSFTVEYYNEDQSKYVMPGCPCKGGGKSEFEFMVVKEGEQYLVLDLPPIELPEE